MPLPPGLLTTTCDIYRPFGDASPTYTAVPCRLGTAPMAGIKPEGLAWSHTLDLQPGTDLRDAASRTAAKAEIAYGDGDEVRVPSGGSTRYVVVWVEVVARGPAAVFARLSPARHAVVAGSVTRAEGDSWALSAIVGFPARELQCLG